ncbi:MAG: ATP-dependent Clp protease ATP-binding subunit [Acutalibacteraceae bacterium]|nr:ATP-dependent Clp protease ATP-binding subunit [Acutalibacteraceae bacterium]
MRLCYKCQKRPAVVFISDAMNKDSEPKGLCLVCAKTAGIKPIDDMLGKMNISDEEIEQMSDQFMEIMSMNEENGNEMFDLGTAPAFPFLNNMFSDGNKNEKNGDRQNDKNDTESKAERKKKRFLEQYCTNLTERAKNGQLDEIFGREEELYRTIQILSRRTKNNPCLIGEPGVGKTAIAEGLALKIARGDAPARLLDKEIHLLDLTGLVAGTQFRGQFESRVKGLVEEIKTAKNIILFIDEIHNLVGAGDSAEGSMNAANILKPALSRGEIQVIGATTFKEYRKYIEKDAALERRFQPVTIEEPSLLEAEKVLYGIKKYYEGYHNVTIPDKLISTIVRLSERYVNDRFLPDKAIDLMDEACACASLANSAVDQLYIANKKIAEAQMEIDRLEAEVENPDYEKLALVKFELEKYKKQANDLYVPASDNTVTDYDVAKVIELWTGIPAAKIQENDLNKLKNLDSEILKRIIGQDKAVELVVSAVKRSRIQMSTKRRPASFIFVGPTGVGKTELVKVLSEQLFDTPETMIRLDMSEFMEKHSVSRLIGAPPGYVGYDEAGQLTEKVRRKPYSVVLFDEIEKAHPDILNILLQILDDGRITDAQGRTVNFENTIIVMTSNAGSDKQSSLLGFEKSEAQVSEEKAKKALSEFLRPEFIARVDEIIVFAPLGEEALSKICALMLEEIETAMSYKRIELCFDKSVCDYIAKKCVGAKSGARELRNFIRRNIEDKIVAMLIDNSTASINKLCLSVNNDTIVINS